MVLFWPCEQGGRRDVTLTTKTIVMSLLAVLLLAGPAAARIPTASMVVDADTGEVLQASNVDSRNYPASLTKMMTLYLLFDALDAGKAHLSDRIPMSHHAASQAPTKLGIAAGRTLTVEAAMLGMITRSANDAAVAIAEHLAGSEAAFAQRMTQKAHELGMSKTSFFNASGLPNSNQKSTARDMTTLARALLHNHAKHYRYFATREFEFEGTTIRGHNHLMDWYDGADGIKTGYTDASGFNLVASAKRGGRRLIGVVFGGQTGTARDRQMARLLDAGFARTPGSSGVELAELPEQSEIDDGAAKGRTARTPVKRQAVAHAAARVQTAAGDSDDEDWAIELGSFPQVAKAQQLADATLASLGKLTADGEAKAMAAKKGAHTLYRARIVGLSQNDARQACHSLTKHHHACRTVNLG
jgi:D-alanyl-D-alanine carboxypeptidase